MDKHLEQDGIELKVINTTNDNHDTSLEQSRKEVISVKQTEEIPSTPVVEEISDNCCSVDKPIPMIGFLKRYKKDYFFRDLIAGLSLGIITIPQGMSNSLLANLPPVYGLYGSIVPPFIYCLFSTSPHNHIGPYAVLSIIIASFGSFIDYETEESEYIGVVMMMGFLSGLLLTILGLLHMGSITRILSDPVVSSFTAASAVNIVTSQICHFFGVKGANGSPLKQLIHLLSPSVIQQYNWYAFILGISSSTLLYLLKVVNKKYIPHIPIPTELFIVIIYIFLMWYFNLSERWHIKYIGDYPVVSGFPPFSLPSFHHCLRLIPAACVIAIISFSSTVSLAKSFARQLNYRIVDDQELIALGLSHFIGSFFSSLPCAVSLSRSSVAVGIGSKTPIISIYSVLICLFSTFYLMDILKFIPNAVLTTVVIVNLFGVLAKFKEVPRLWKSSPSDFWASIITTVVLLIFGAEAGLFVGIAASLVLLWLYKRNTKKILGIEDLPEDDQTVVKASDTLHFINRDVLVHKVEKLVHHGKVKKICIDLRVVRFIDASGMNALHDISSFLKQRVIPFSFLAQNDMISTKLKNYKMNDVIITKADEKKNLHYLFISLF